MKDLPGKICELWSDGMAIAAIASKFGIDEDEVENVLFENDLI